MDGFGLREAESVMDAVNDVGFGKAHGGDPFRFLREVSFKGVICQWIRKAHSSPFVTLLPASPFLLQDTNIPALLASVERL